MSVGYLFTVARHPIYRGTSSEIPLPSPSQPFPPIATPVLDWYLATATPVLDWYLAPWKKYAVFTGRARRKEFWLFNLGNLIIALVLILSEGLFGIAAETDESVLAALFQLAILVPSLAVAVRRMHDIDCSGWMGFVPLFNLFLCVCEWNSWRESFRSRSEGCHVLTGT